jgi:hypothetical protein
MTMNTPNPLEAVHVYVEAWNTPDEQARNTLLEQCWAEDGTYLNPHVEIHGREELSAYIGRFLERRASGLGPGFRTLISSGVDHHHKVARFSWTILDPSGSPVSYGSNFGEFAPDGQFQRITVFFGPLPSMPHDWPNRLVWHEGPKDTAP